MIRKTLTDIADQFQYWLKNRSAKWGAPILEAPEGDDSRRDRLLDPYFENAQPNQVVAIVKAREPARILVAIGNKDNDSSHLEYKQRWVNQFNFYLSDVRWGRMFVRMCPYSSAASPLERSAKAERPARTLPGVHGFNRATSYSPTHFRRQYHRG